jgi:prepilin-type N-terminal cleavage/methylation domain-containing protein
MGKMKTAQRGFTLIELVMVIVILGILAAVAIPKFVDLSGDAKQAAVDGMAGALASGAAINYAARSAKATNGVAVANCDDTKNTLQQWDSSFTIGGTNPSCTVAKGGVTGTFATILIN